MRGTTQLHFEIICRRPFRLQHCGYIVDVFLARKAHCVLLFQWLFQHPLCGQLLMANCSLDESSSEHFLQDFMIFVPINCVLKTLMPRCSAQMKSIALRHVTRSCHDLLRTVVLFSGGEKNLNRKELKYIQRLKYHRDLCSFDLEQEAANPKLILLFCRDAFI